MPTVLNADTIFLVNFVWSQKVLETKKSQRRLPLWNHQETKLGAAPLIINGEQRFLGDTVLSLLQTAIILFFTLTLEALNATHTHMHACKSQLEVCLFCQQPLEWKCLFCLEAYSWTPNSAAVPVVPISNLLVELYSITKGPSAATASVLVVLLFYKA